MSYNACNPFASSSRYPARSFTQSSKISSRVTGAVAVRDAYRADGAAIDPASDPIIDSRRTPLHEAASAGDFQEVQRLIARGGSRVNQVDRLGFTPLHLATAAGNAHTVRLLLGNDAGKSINTPAFAGYTPLAICCNAAKGAGSADIARMLLKAGADSDVYLPGFGASRHAPIHLAAIKGHAEIVRVLLDSGVNVNQTLEGSTITPLALAIQYAQHDVVSVLRERGGLESSRITSAPLDRRYSSKSIRRVPTAASPHSPFLIAQELAKRRAQSAG